MVPLHNYSQYSDEQLHAMRNFWLTMRPSRRQRQCLDSINSVLAHRTEQQIQVKEIAKGLFDVLTATSLFVRS